MTRDKKEWENARIFAISREPARCSSTPHADPEAALGGGTSPYVKSLDGDWRFHFAPKPAERAIGFEDPAYDVSGWGTIPVPSNWELHGHGAPIYAPFHMPKSLRKTDMPDIDPDNNPVGSYRTTFTLPAGWEGRDAVLRFGGVCSAFTCWVNGAFIGYSQDSMLPAEFTITPHLVDWR